MLCEYISNQVVAFRYDSDLDWFKTLEELGQLKDSTLSQ